MKKVTYSEKITQDSALHSFAQRATATLDEVLGQSAGLVDAVWDRVDDGKGRTLITLRISDWTGAAEAKFAPWELEQSIRLRLYHLWGDLLQARSHMQV